MLEHLTSVVQYVYWELSCNIQRILAKPLYSKYAWELFCRLQHGLAASSFNSVARQSAMEIVCIISSMPCTPCFSDVFSCSPEMEARLRECEQRFGKLSTSLESQHFFFWRVWKPLVVSECVPLEQVNQCNGFLRTRTYNSHFDA